MSAGNFFWATKKEQNRKKNSWLKFPHAHIRCNIKIILQSFCFSSFAVFCFIVNKFHATTCLARFFRNREENRKEKNLDKPDDRPRQYMHAAFVGAWRGKQPTLVEIACSAPGDGKYEINLSRLFRFIIVSNYGQTHSAECDKRVKTALNKR